MTLGTPKLRPSGFTVKPPDKKRRTFQVLPYARVDGKKRYLGTLKHEALDALNQELLSGRLTQAEAALHLKKVLLPKLRGDFRMPEKMMVDALIGEQNLRAFTDFWGAVYRRKRIDAPETARQQFLYALRAMEPHSLLATDIDVLQLHWDRKLSGTKHKRYGARINQLLKHLKRGVTLSLDKADRPETRWVTWPELQAILAHVSDSVLRDLYETLWATGCRLGEVFPLDESDLMPDCSIYIQRQLTRQLKVKPYTKNRNEHKTLVIPLGLAATRRWLAVENKGSYRNRCSHPLADASKKAFPRNPEKWVSPHKLRHSYVHYMVSKGVSLNEIKNLIGDTLKTTEETYSGWVISSDSIDQVMQKIR